MNAYVHPYLQPEDTELQDREYRWRQKVNIYQPDSLFSCPGRYKGWAEITFLHPPPLLKGTPCCYALITQILHVMPGHGGEEGVFLAPECREHEFLLYRKCIVL